MCNLLALDGGFSLMMRLSGDGFDTVRTCVWKRVQEAIDNCHACGDGGWIHFSAQSEEDADDVRTLLNQKCKIFSGGGSCGKKQLFHI